MPHGAIQVDCTNKSMTAILNNPIHYDNTKHIKMDWYVLRAKIDGGIINCIANIFTKGLPARTCIPVVDIQYIHGQHPHQACGGV